MGEFGAGRDGERGDAVADGVRLVGYGCLDLLDRFNCDSLPCDRIVLQAVDDQDRDWLAGRDEKKGWSRKMTSIESTTERPLVTFALFAYNQEKYIREAVEGAFAQTYEPLEIILSDDCSTDRTFEIMEKMTRNYNGPHKVVLNRNECNLGLVQHFNRILLDVSKGELIVVAAGDDISLPERTIALYNAWNTTGRKAYSMSSDVILINKDGATVNTALKFDDGFMNISLYEFVNNLPKGCYGCTALYNRHIFKVFGPITDSIVEDTNTFIRSMIIGRQEGYLRISKSLIKYRITGSNLSLVENTKDKIVRFSLFKKYIYMQLEKDMDRAIEKKYVNEDEAMSIKRLAMKKINHMSLKCSLSSDKYLVRISVLLRLFKYEPVINVLKYAAIFTLPQSLCHMLKTINKHS